jgi:8-oxo-dGTP pyrophosphatase MutT (NUDIX family)
VGSVDPFARTTLPAHVTASAVVLDQRGGAVLLHLHRRLDRWLQPGGHIEPGEAPERAAIRETVEETGVAVRHPEGGPQVLHLDEHPGPDGHVHLDLRYLLLADRSEAPIARGETTGDGPGPTLRWATGTEAAALGDDSLGRAIAALARAVR